MLLTATVKIQARNTTPRVASDLQISPVSPIKPHIPIIETAVPIATQSSATANDILFNIFNTSSPLKYHAART